MDPFHGSQVPRSDLPEFTLIVCFSWDLSEFTPIVCFSQDLLEFTPIICFSRGLPEFILIVCFSRDILEFMLQTHCIHILCLAKKILLCNEIILCLQYQSNGAVLGQSLVL